MSSNSVQIIHQLHRDFQELVEYVTGKEAQSRTAYEVELALFRRLLKLSLVEPASHAGNVLGGVEIQMDLSKPDSAHSVLSSILNLFPDPQRLVGFSGELNRTIAIEAVPQRRDCHLPGIDDFHYVLAFSG